MISKIRLSGSKFHLGIISFKNVLKVKRSIVLRKRRRLCFWIAHGDVFNGKRMCLLVWVANGYLIINTECIEICYSNCTVQVLVNMFRVFRPDRFYIKGWATKNSIYTGHLFVLHSFAKRHQNVCGDVYLNLLSTNTWRSLNALENFHFRRGYVSAVVNLVAVC